MNNPSIENIKSAINYVFLSLKSRLDVINSNTPEVVVLEAPTYVRDETPFALFLEQFQPSTAEYITIVLALIPHLQPDFFETIIQEYLPGGSDFPAFGGVKGQNHRGLLPTGETAQFILAGNDLEKRLEVQQLFTSDHWFAQKGILWLESVRDGEPLMSGRLILDAEWVQLMTTGKVTPPRFGNHFPAEKLGTQLTWKDLVLPANTMRQIEEIEIWVKHHETLLNEWGMRSRVKPGYRALFYGSPGTGKTLTATLLGKYTGKEVYRVDLSLVVSKFIGETEKNLSMLFEKARNKDWILFFDEADALFGKRTDVRDAHDKYANQEVSYLLQKIEDFPGVTILASNFKSNIDEAFVRRFQSVIFFPIPRPEDRLLLWNKSLPSTITIHQELSLEQIANKYELTGSNIVNVIQYCCLQMLAHDLKVLNKDLIISGIQRELYKENKII